MAIGHPGRTWTKGSKNWPAADDAPDPDAPEFPKPTGGGWFELSNGERVQGRDAADEAQAALDADTEP